MKRVLKKGLTGIKKAANSNKYTRKMARGAKRVALAALATSNDQEIYNLSTFYPTINDYYHQIKESSKETNPLISILLPTYNTPEAYLRECIESIIVQSYQNWELCIADDKSSDPRVVKIIREYQKQDARIKLIERPENGHISLATNSALEVATGEFVGLMDHDDVLWPNALYEVTRVIKAKEDVDFIYSDEDKIDGGGTIHSYPFLKPDFSPEFLESCNYITHFSCIRKRVMEDIGGFRKGYEGAQDWDLFIRIAETTQNIVHIPKLLYSWRIHEASTASDTDAKPYVYEAQKKLLVDHIDRQVRQGEVETGIIRQHRTIKYALEPKTKITVIIFYSNLENLTRLARSMEAHPAGVAHQLIVVSETALGVDLNEVKTLFPQATHEIVANSGIRNYVGIANRTEAGYLIFIDDSIELVSDDWAKTLVADNQLPGVGVVGAVLLNQDRSTLRSAGVGVGYGPQGVADMLQDMPFDDPHYSRGLYAKSRRNVSAVNNTLFCVSRKALGDHPNQTVIDLCIDLLRDHRHIYTPYVQAILHDTIYKEVPKIASDKSYEDTYLNQNFNHSNQRMEVRA